MKAAFSEDTPDSQFQEQVDAYELMSDIGRYALAAELLTSHASDVKRFVNSLATAVSRQIERVVILPLHGSAHDWSTIDDAVSFITNYARKTDMGPVHRYEILIRYNNGDKIEAAFKDKENAIKHLRSYQPISSALQG